MREMDEALEDPIKSFEEGEDIRFVNFRYTMPINSYVQLRARSPLTGLVTHLLIHYPAGCLSLVDIRVSVRAQQIYPNVGWVALDDATPLFRFSKGQPIERRDALDVEIQNRDTINPHTVTIILTLEGSVTPS